jgi:hypothetical protein
MPAQRTSLGVISGNRHHKKELNPYQRGFIVGYASAGITPTSIAKTLKLSQCTIASTIELDPLRINGASQPRSGRPKVYTEADYRLLL